MVRSFDYEAPAELFPTRSRKGNRPMGYPRFAKSGEAIQFAMEELSPELLIGAYLEVEDEQFDSEGIRRLYEQAEIRLLDAPLLRPDECHSGRPWPRAGSQHFADRPSSPSSPLVFHVGMGEGAGMPHPLISGATHFVLVIVIRPTKPRPRSQTAAKSCGYPPMRHHPDRLKYCTARSCFSALRASRNCPISSASRARILLPRIQTILA